MGRAHSVSGSPRMRRDGRVRSGSLGLGRGPGGPPQVPAPAFLTRSVGRGGLPPSATKDGDGLSDHLEHEITGCAGCNAEAHQQAVEEREKQQREDNVIMVGLTLAAAFVGLVVLGLWAGVMVLLSNIT